MVEKQNHLVELKAANNTTYNHGTLIKYFPAGEGRAYENHKHLTRVMKYDKYN